MHTALIRQATGSPLNQRVQTIHTAGRRGSALQQPQYTGYSTIPDEYLVKLSDAERSTAEEFLSGISVEWQLFLDTVSAYNDEQAMNYLVTERVPKEKAHIVLGIIKRKFLTNAASAANATRNASGDASG